VAAFIQKPYAFGELVQILHAILTKSR